MRAKSYTSLWAVKGTLYSIGDLKLLFPVTYQQIAWFLAGLFFMLMFGGVLPLASNTLIRYLVYPVVLTWFMSQKSFDGKPPLQFIISVLGFYLRPKMTYGERKIANRKRERFWMKTTAVRSEVKRGTGN